MSGYWSSAWDAITGAVAGAAGHVANVAKDGLKSDGWLTQTSKWMNNNKEMTNLLGTTLIGIGGYFAQKQASKDLMRQQKEMLNLQDKLKSKYSAVPKDPIDFTYKSLTVDETPNLANGGILTELKKRYEQRGGV